MPDTAPLHADRLGHPPGLWVLAGTELWDRISFKGMQAVLVLYMAGELFRPGAIERVAGLAAFRSAIEALTGPLAPEPLAAQVFGIYIALVTLTPLIGGFIGDRWTGRRAAVVAGALLMTAGHFALAFDRTFMVALLLLVLGVGLFKGNLSAQVRALYAAGDRRAADAFQIYLIAVNAGGIVAPLLTGSLAAVAGWHAGFAAAGIGMLVGLAIYLAGGRFLPSEPSRTARRDRPPLTAQERRSMAGLALLWPFLVGFWIVQSQVWNLYNLWLRDHVDRRIDTFEVPVPWFASLDSLAPVLLAPLVIGAWRWQARRGREPRLLAKMATGCLMMAAATGLLVLASADAKADMAWPLAFHILANLGWLFFVPVETTVFAGEAPERMRGTMLGVAALSVSAASLISGRMGSLYAGVEPATFWAINAAIAATTGIALMLAAPLLRRRLPSA